MAALNGSRHYILIRKWINPHTISTEVLNGHQHYGTKYHPWNKNTLLCSLRYYFTSAIHISRKNLFSKNQGCLSYPKNERLCKIAHSCSRRPYSFPLQTAREKEVFFGRLSLQKLENLCSGQNDQVSRPFHGSPVLKAVPGPILMLILKPLQKLFAIILGRSIRKWWKALPPNKKELFKEAARKNKWKIALGLCGFGVVFIIFYSTHLEKTPITGRTRLLLFSNEQFAELSQIEYKMWLENFENKILPETDPLHQLIKGTIIHLAESNKDVPQLSEFQWTIHVVEEQSIMNAFVFPSGEVIFFTGMLNAVSDIDQLCFVLGHEISHAVLGHAAEKASLVHILDFLSLILLTMIWAVCPRDSLAIIGQWIQARFQELLFVMPYNRTLEAEADKVGLQFAAKACMDVRASSVFWQQMELSETILGKSKVPEWLSTHPSHQNRAKLLDRLIPEALKIREKCNCPVLPSQDPRLIFKLSQQLLRDRNMSSVPDHGLDKTKVTLPFSKKEKTPLDVAADKGLQR